MRWMVTLVLLVGLFLPLTVLPQPPEARLEEFEALKVWRLTRELDLTEEEASRLFPLLKRHSRLRRELLREHRKELRELEELLRQSAPEERIREQIGRVEASLRQMDEARWREWEEIKEVLPVHKQARYLIFQDRFMRDFWKTLMRCPPK